MSAKLDQGSSQRGERLYRGDGQETASRGTNTTINLVRFMRFLSTGQGGPGEADRGTTSSFRRRENATDRSLDRDRRPDRKHGTAIRNPAEQKRKNWPGKKNVFHMCRLKRKKKNVYGRSDEVR